MTFNCKCGLSLLIAGFLSFPSLAAAQDRVVKTHRVLPGSTDIGPTLRGSTAYDPKQEEYRVTGGGADMWGAVDAFHLSWTKLSGDATLTADVHFPSGNLAPLEKAVLIFRQGLDSASPYADVAIHADGHITLQYRKILAGQTEDTTSTEHGSTSAPTRLRIERKGDQFTVSAGPGDGNLVASPPVTVILHDPVYVGIGVCAHDTNRLATVTFTNVRLERTSPPVTGKNKRHPIPEPDPLAKP